MKAPGEANYSTCDVLAVSVSSSLSLSLCLQLLTNLHIFNICYIF